MRYYIKFFNKTTHKFVGYYKTTGKNCISLMENGMKWFDNLAEAIAVADEFQDAFLRDKDKHYYTAFVAVYGDHTKQSPKEYRKTGKEKEEELEDELNAFIRKNSHRDF